MKVINWSDLSLTDEDLEKTLASVKGVNPLRVVSRELVKVILSQYPWDEREDLVEIFDPSHSYEKDDWVALPKKDKQGLRPDSWRIAKVKKVEDTENPVQGSFRVVWVESEGKEKVLACNIPTGSPFPLQFPPEDEEEWDMLAGDLVDAYGIQLREALLQAIDDERLIVLADQDQALRSEELIQFSEEEQAAIKEAFEVEREGRLYTTTQEILDFLREKGWLCDVPDKIARFSIEDYLQQSEDTYVSLGFSRWIPRDRFAEIDRTIAKRPKVPVIPSKVAQEQGIDDSPDFGDYDEVELDEEGQKELREMGEEESETEPKQAFISLEEWRRRAPTRAVKLPTITYQNIIEGFLPLTSGLSKCFPPVSNKTLVNIQIIDGDPLPFTVDWEEGLVKALDKETFRLKFLEKGIPAGTYLWLERISDTEYRLKPRPLSRPRREKCKLAWIEDGELKFATEEIELRYESNPALFKAELRFQDLEALFREAEELGWSIFDAMWYTFPELAKLDPEGKVHHTELFNAVFFKYRMCSPRSIQTELYRRPCFVPLGNGYWKFEPSRGVKPKQVRSSKRRQRRISLEAQVIRRPERHISPRKQKPQPEVPRPEEAIWSEIGKLVGRELKTLDKGKPFKILEVDNSKVEIFITHTGKSRKIQRSEIQGSWNRLIQKGELSLSDIRQEGYSEYSPTYVATILAALPGVTYVTNPIRLSYHRPKVPDIGIRDIIYPVPFANASLSPEVREGLSKRLGPIRRGFGFIFWYPSRPKGLDEYLQQYIADKSANRFVTPREVVDFMVNLAQPKPGERVADICCGTGIFLVKALRFVKEVYGEDTDLELYGADIYDKAVEASRLNLLANGARNFTVIQADSLQKQGDIFDQKYDLILGNPPFGGGQCKQFIYRWIDLLKDGGRIVVNVSEGVLANTGQADQELRNWLVGNFEIKVVVSLPRPYDSQLYGTKSNVLFLRKVKPKQGIKTLLIQIENYAQIDSVLDICKKGGNGDESV